LIGFSRDSICEHGNLAITWEFDTRKAKGAKVKAVSIGYRTNLNHKFRLTGLTSRSRTCSFENENGDITGKLCGTTLKDPGTFEFRSGEFVTDVRVVVVASKSNATDQTGRRWANCNVHTRRCTSGKGNGPKAPPH
jgi:hypothetical protein